jgi:hypothetical protein
MEVASEVPAARPLADVAAYCALVAQLRAGDGGRRLRQHAVLRVHRLVRRHLRVGRQRPDAQAARGDRRDASQVLQARQAHDLVRREHFVAQASEQVRPARVQPGPGRGQLPDRVGDRFRLDVGEVRQHG